MPAPFEVMAHASRLCLRPVERIGVAPGWLSGTWLEWLLSTSPECKMCWLGWARSDQTTRVGVERLVQASA